MATDSAFAGCLARAGGNGSTGWGSQIAANLRGICHWRDVVLQRPGTLVARSLDRPSYGMEEDPSTATFDPGAQGECSGRRVLSRLLEPPTPVNMTGYGAVLSG